MPRNEQKVQEWWADLFDTGPALWSAVTIRQPHGSTLGSYPGWYVAWRGEGVHVSAPPTATAADLALLRAESPATMRDPAFWHTLADRLDLTVVGPATHHHLDRVSWDPAVPEEVEQVVPRRLSGLRAEVDDVEWEESGLSDALVEDVVALAFWHDGFIRGGAVLREVQGGHRDIGVLVGRRWRGQGLGLALGRAAAAYAVSWHGYARWRTRDGNAASQRTARRLGFEPYATQLALRPALTPAG